MKKEKKQTNEGLRVRSTPPFKLKDKQGRSFQVLKLMDFGFYPEAIIIEKVPGENNTLIIRAVLTDDEVKREDERLEKLKIKN